MARQLPPILAELRRTLLDGVRRIDNDECSEAYVAGMMSRFNAESKGYYNDESFANYDEAMRTVEVGSRNKLNELCKQHGIKQKRISNMPVGFLRAEIEYLRTILRGKKKGKADT